MPAPDYVLRLRERIGHELLWLPGATAVVLRGDDVLLVRRADNGEWAPVTGIVDPGEHPADTAEREVLEETGVACTVDELVLVDVTTPRAYPNGDRAQYLDLTFRCRYVEGEARVADDESVDVAWFPADALPAMNPGLTARVRAALDPPGRVGVHRGPRT